MVDNKPHLYTLLGSHHKVQMKSSMEACLTVIKGAYPEAKIVYRSYLKCWVVNGSCHSEEDIRRAAGRIMLGQG